MSNPIVDFPSQFIAGPAGAGTVMVSANTRVRTHAGFVGTQLDALLFANGTGRWMTGTTRTRVHGVFVVSATSQGIAYPAGSPSPVSMFVVSPNNGVRGQ